MPYTTTLSKTGVYKLATANQGVGPGGWTVIVTANTNSNGTAWNGSLVLGQNRNPHGAVAEPIGAGSLTTVPYITQSTGAAVAAGTAITGAATVNVMSTGYSLYLNYTQTSANTTVTVSVQPAAKLALTVTQATNRTTGVTLPACLSGIITTDTTSLAGLAGAAFVVTNPAVNIGDTVGVNIESGSNGGNTFASVSTVTNGSFSILISNGNAAAGTAETGACVLNFAVQKA